MLSICVSDVVKETIQELNVCSVCDDFFLCWFQFVEERVLKVEDPYLEWSSTRQSANVPSKNSLCLLCSFSLEILNVYY